MNKMLRAAIVLALALIVACSMFSVAFAAGSPVAGDEVTRVVDSTGDDVEYSLSDVDSSIPPLVPAAAKDLNVSEDQIIVLLEKDLSPEGTAPFTVSYNVGADGQTIYAYHYNGQAWERVGSSYTGAKFEVKYDSLSPVGLVTLKDSTPSSGGKSDKTGENNLPLYAAFAAVILGGAAAGMSLRKKHN